MPSPFPGMDPYLESPTLWPDVHHEIISQIRAALNPALRPRYVARVELRVYISDDDDPGREVMVPDLKIEKPKRRAARKARNGSAAIAITEPLIVRLQDDEIEEARLEIRHVESQTLVTVIEVMSPTNKIRGSRGRESFMAKRQEILDSPVHWVELDLVRAGRPSMRLRPCDYRILVSRAERRPRVEFWPVSVRHPLPVIGIPLRGKDADVPLALGEVLKTAYDHAAYDVSIDYRKPPVPPLEGDDATWAEELVRERRK